jgi:hypothetical protein
MINGVKEKIAKLAEYDIQHHASLLKWTTLIIWACSLAAEVGTFAANKKLPHKEKSFIIKQELTAGGISLAIMYLLADRFEKLGSKAVKSARLFPAFLPEKFRTPQAIEKILASNDSFIKKELGGKTELVEKLIQFEKGMSVTAGTIGTILAFNITTPLISNKIASYFQNKELAKKAQAGTVGVPVMPLPQEVPVPGPIAVPARPVTYTVTRPAASAPVSPAAYSQPLYNRYSPFQQTLSPYR